MQSEDGLYKIGYSKDPPRRCRNLNCASLRVDLIHQIATDNMPRLEGILQQRYRKKHVRGEWFALDEKDIAEIRGMHLIYFQDDE